MVRYLSLALAATLLAAGQLWSQQVKPVSQGDCPCCTPEHRAFDFWEGEWDVQTPDGSPAGTNRIVKGEGGCVLQEFWKGASGDTGTSLNFYNLAAEQWEQLWVDNSGRALKLAGRGSNGQMVMSSEPFRDSEGRIRMHRISWTLQADGSVRQLWEVLEGQEVVQTLFDGIYRRRQ